MYDAVIFDNDGVIVELTDRTIFRRAVHDAFAALGVPDPTPGDLDALQFVATDRVTETLEPIADTYDIEMETLWTARDEFAVTAQLNAVENGRKPLYDDVDALDDLDVPLGVVSNNQHATVEGVLDHHGIADRFETRYGRDHSLAGIRQKKPNPYYLEQAIADLDADNPLYVGDSGTDLIAADRAGIAGAFLRRAHRRDYELPISPTHELGSLAELPDLLNGSR